MNIMEKEKRKPIFIFLVAFGVAAAVAITGWITTTVSSQLPDLNASVSSNKQGISVTNLESTAWRGCEVGVNGGCGINFWHPMYQTHENMTIMPGQAITVPYGSMADKDGSQYSGQPTSIVVMCSLGTHDPVERSWCGGTPPPGASE